MAASVTHTKVSTVPDGPDADLVRPSDWNDDHTVSITPADIGAEVAGTTATHTGDTSAAHAASSISIADAGSDFTATDVEGALDELQSDNEAHVAASDPHSGYVLESLFDAAGDLITASADNTPAKLTKGTQGQLLAVGASTIGYEDRHTQVTFAKQGTVAVTTESTPVHHWTNDTGRTLTIVKVRARAEVGPSGTTQVIDINYDGTTIFTSTKVVLPDSTGGVSTVLTNSGFAVTSVADGHVLSMNVDATLATGLASLTVTVWMVG